MGKFPSSFLIDTDIFIDYLNGVSTVKNFLDSPGHKIYYSMVTRKELLRKPGLSSIERGRIERLLAKHRLIPVDNQIAEKFSQLLSPYTGQGIRKADALIAATAWVKKLPLVTRNIKHYQFINEIDLVKISSSTSHQPQHLSNGRKPKVF